MPALPAAARRRLDDLGEPIARLDAEIAGIDARLMARHKAGAVSSLLAEVPGIGKIAALSLALRTDPTPFRSGRHVAAGTA